MCVLPGRLLGRSLFPSLCSFLAVFPIPSHPIPSQVTFARKPSLCHAQVGVQVLDPTMQAQIAASAAGLPKHANRIISNQPFNLNLISALPCAGVPSFGRSAYVRSKGRTYVRGESFCDHGDREKGSIEWRDHVCLPFLPHLRYPTSTTPPPLPHLPTSTSPPPHLPTSPPPHLHLLTSTPPLPHLPTSTTADAQKA